MSDQYTIDILKLPFVLFTERTKLPLTGGIYFVIRPNPEQLCYIGKAQNLRARWSNHHRAGQMIATSRIHWMYCRDEQDRTILEGRLIAFYNPPWNGRMPDPSLPELAMQISHMQLEINALKADARQHQTQWLYMCERETHFQRIEKALFVINDVARYMGIDRDELLARILTAWAYNRKES
jgi:excinuclease UvrABC nuclease subunit